MSGPNTALVLAAGFGTRLRPLTNERPKALIEIGNRPMIEYPLRMLAAGGVETAVVNLHHRGDELRSVLEDGRRFGLRILYSPEDPILDTGGAIARARPQLGDGSFWVANCDAILDADLDAIAKAHERSGALATLVVREDPEADRYGAIELDQAGRIRRFLGRPDTVSGKLRKRMFCGIHLVSPRIFTRMPSRQIFSITRDVYRGLVESGEDLFGFEYSGYWRDPGTLETLEAARNDAASGRFSPAYLSRNPLENPHSSKMKS